MKIFKWIGLLVISLILVMTLVLAALYVWYTPEMGELPNEDHIEIIQQSANYDISSERFINRQQAKIDAAMFDWLNWSSMKTLFTDERTGAPARKLPEQKPAWEDFLKADNQLKVIWLGHSSLLINLEGKTILVDPVFGAASPIDMFAERFQPPIVAIEDLPPIDFLLVSHDHYDHLEMDTIKYFSNTDTQFITPLGVSSYVVGWGADKKSTNELDWWEKIQFEKIEFIATPSQHFSGRHGVFGNQTQWASWVIRSPNHAIYFSGDSGYDTHFKEIGEKYGPFDVAFIENGQYNQAWHLIHLLPKDGIQAFKDLNAKAYFPIHWGMFDLAPHNWYDPVEEISQLGADANIKIITPRLGETLVIDGSTSTHDWWREYISK